MQFAAVALPVAAATIVNVPLAWFAWKGTAVERRDGRPPWQLEAGVVAYIAALAATAYLLKDAPISAPLGVFGAAFAGEGFGGLVLYTIGRAYQMRREPWSRRGLPTMAAVIFTFAVFASVLTS